MEAEQGWSALEMTSVVIRAALMGLGVTWAISRLVLAFLAFLGDRPLRLILGALMTYIALAAIGLMLQPDDPIEDYAVNGVLLLWLTPLLWWSAARRMKRRRESEIARRAERAHRQGA